VGEALDEIPAELASLMDNVVVVVEEGSEGGGMLGRYEGVPLTERGGWYGTGDLVMPDRITVFRRPICALVDDEDELVRHKIHDAIGDLYLLGHSLIGSFSGYKSGHEINNKLLRKLLSEQEAWEILSFEDSESAPISYLSGAASIA